MPDLESFLSQWRQTLLAAPNLTAETLDELESHLRERVAQLVHSGLPEAEACQRAAAELGSPETIATEFGKLHALPWLPAKIMSGLGVALALVLATVFLGRPFTQPGADTLLAVLVFTVSVGSPATILLGVLGACFVLQRAYSGFSPRRLAPLSRVSLAFGTVGAVFTAIGIILAMFWARREWGRAWDWDAKEIGAFCVIVWMSAFLIAHAFRRVTTRALLVASVLGSNVVLLGWLGGNLAAESHAYGRLNAAWLLAPVIINLLFAILGFVPAGCLGRRRA